MGRLSVAAVSVALLSAACGCILGSDQNAAADAPKVSAGAASDDVAKDARVGAKFQTQMLELLKSDAQATDAYGVFTEGGWSNAGQTMVLTGAERKAPRVVLVAPNRAQVAADRAATEDEWKAVEPAVKSADGLASVDVEGFDHLIWEYVHLRKADGKVEVAHRVFVSNPGVKELPEHDKVFKAFQTLQGTK